MPLSDYVRRTLRRARAGRDKGGDMRMVAVLALGTLLLAPQAYATEWGVKASVVSGQCGSGAIATVVEGPGALKITISLNGKKSGEADVKLAADGSGSTQMQGAAGPVYLDVTPGTGKRALKTRLV